MEYPFSSKEKGLFSTWPSPRAMDDPFNSIQELMDFDAYTGWSPASTDLIFTSCTSSPPTCFTNSELLNFSQQKTDTFPDTDSVVEKEQNGNFSMSDTNSYMTVARPLGQPSLAEKMLKALSLFKQSSRGGILAQVWVPIKNGDRYVLSTCEQPYLLDQMLSGYREVSRAFTFSVEVTPSVSSGLPGRVYTSKAPEWTSNVSYYNKSEYLRAKHAIDHEVRGSMAIPIFSHCENSCCAVLELVTMKEKPDFDSEMEAVCSALHAVNLRTTSPPRLQSQHLSYNKRAALSEIMDVLRTICHAHILPLALTWVPCAYTEKGGDECARRLELTDVNNNTSPNGKHILCVEDTSCYVNDINMQGFVQACAEHYLEIGQGIAGKALQSIHPFFFPDVKEYDISMYPLVHHARKFGLNAAVAIRLRSTYTGDDDYILEFFLPLNMKGSTEQQLLLNNLAGTMQRICTSLRTVSEEELVQGSGSKVENQMAMPKRSSELDLTNRGINSIKGMSVNESITRIDGKEANDFREQGMNGSRRQQEKKRNTAEKSVSLSVLQQYFSGSLKDAAKGIGVCPTTLKRICRQHGISRWPSRKIKKVNRSLRKIQTVLDSVQGVEGGLKFDPITGELVASSSITPDFDLQSIPLFPSTILPLKSLDTIKFENEDCFMEDSREKSNFTLVDSAEIKKSNFNHMDTKMEGDHGIIEHNSRPSSSSMTDSSNGSGSMLNSNSSSSPSQEKIRTSSVEDGLKSSITVKARYKEDTIRFKFEPSSGFFQLYEEVAKRFRLQTGAFQLRYLDDDDEWVMLVSDSDLQECLEVLEFVGTRSVKFLVRDMPCAFGSSSSSNCFLT